MKYLKIILLLLISIEVKAQLPNYVPTNGLVGWWPFNGNANDESGNGKNGAVDGAILSNDRFGLNNRAYSFDGNLNKITANIGQINSFSISMWYNADAPINWYPQLVVYGQRPTNFNELIQLLGNNPTYVSQNRQNRINLGFAGLESSFSPSLNNWHHVTSVFNSVQDTAYLYIDGILIGKKLFTGELKSTNGNLYFGNSVDGVAMDGSGKSGYKGVIDDIGLWNRALTQQEITNLYNANLCFETVRVTDTLVININRTSVNPVTYSNTIKVYPNPSNNQITIDNGDLSKMNGYSIKIINSLGQQLYQTAINQQQNTIDITQWGGNGMYYLQVIDANGNIIEIKKIILQ